MKNQTANKVLAIIIVVIIVFGWFITLKGIPGVTKPLKDKINLGLDIQGGVYVVLEAKNTDGYSSDELREMMEQTKEVVSNRVDQMGLANPTVSIEGKDRIRVELPGVKNSNEAIEQIGKTAQLRFTLADQQFVLDGSSVKDATSSRATQTGEAGYQVNLEFDSQGSKAFEQATETALAGTVQPNVTPDMCEDGGTVEANQILIWLDNKVISHPRVNEVISGGKCDITGNFSQEEASTLAALIRGGSLPLELEEIQASTQTAQIGENALHQSIKAGIIGIICIFILMIVFYRGMGAVADLALCLYIFLILGGMALVGSVLTLPGIAGIILSIGMAVDANVIIFARIKEEIAAGKAIRLATRAGYRRALTTVLDAQVTTLIAAVILYQLGTSSVKGFAWTLMIGTVCSIITAAFVTQVYLSLMSQSKLWDKKTFWGFLKNGKAILEISKPLKFIKHRKKFYIISVVIILIGVGFIVGKGFNYGIDFTGGTMLHLDMGKKVTTEEVKKVMAKHDVNTKQMQVVFSGDGEKEVIIKTNEAMDNEARQSVIEDMEKSFGISEKDVLASEHFGAAVGKELKMNAFKAIGLAAIGMLIYIRLRFRRWKFGAAALLGVLHDALILMAFYAIFRVTVNNPFIAAILTVVGYSINDTIVIFDRVRENNRFMRKGGAADILDTSIRQTLSRSIMTSLTTLVVMIPLLIIGGEAIREFIMPLMIGVITGTYSSIFICSPLYFEFTKMDANRRAKTHDGTKKKYVGAKPKDAPEEELTDEDVVMFEDEYIEPENVAPDAPGQVDGPAKAAPLDSKKYTPTPRPNTAKEANKGHKKRSRAERKKDKK